MRSQKCRGNFKRSHLAGMEKYMERMKMSEADEMFLDNGYYLTIETKTMRVYRSSLHRITIRNSCAEKFVEKLATSPDMTRCNLTCDEVACCFVAIKEMEEELRRNRLCFDFQNWTEAEKNE